MLPVEEDVADCRQAVNRFQRMVFNDHFLRMVKEENSKEGLVLLSQYFNCMIRHWQDGSMERRTWIAPSMFKESVENVFAALRGPLRIIDHTSAAYDSTPDDLEMAFPLATMPSATGSVDAKNPSPSPQKRAAVGGTSITLEQINDAGMVIIAHMATSTTWRTIRREADRAKQVEQSVARDWNIDLSNIYPRPKNHRANSVFGKRLSAMPWGTLEVFPGSMSAECEQKDRCAIDRNLQ